MVSNAFETIGLLFWALWLRISIVSGLGRKPPLVERFLICLKFLILQYLWLARGSCLVPRLCLPMCRAGLFRIARAFEARIIGFCRCTNPCPIEFRFRFTAPSGSNRSRCTGNNASARVRIRSCRAGGRPCRCSARARTRTGRRARSLCGRLRRLLISAGALVLRGG